MKQKIRMDNINIAIASPKKRYEEIVESLEFDSPPLFRQEQELAAVKSGQANIAIISAPWFTDASPWVSVFTAGHQFKDAAHMNKVLNGDIGQKIFARIIEDQGVRPLGAEYFGTRQISMVDGKPILTPDDLKGVNLRMPTALGMIAASTANFYAKDADLGIVCNQIVNTY